MYIYIYIHTLLCKSLRPVVFSPTIKKKGFKSFAVAKYQFTFPNIIFVINCNNAVRLLSAQGV